ncbi:MAG TPA: acyloxyacyl hydrolase [Thiomonas arsenitoxydans]|uniref:acyloxyacyl hydrolase n=1 Tax=Thiomonas TaxID=32012 RepID=UPI000BC762D9|nr:MULTISPECIES: acyloxyacyl hydrolase [Thiomonas]MDE1977864.1 acyloxyacyl hydrolase [Betaproteobacteria bacterium]OZB73645.1 MAG: acyloxyacyl hydrolase [Thiomonas sp. 14-64-326]MDE2176272.1 acyloxyacyl hydrolase [Betaproteobacteria bacterium]MDE2269093.1 acyloxyacyl hydrolase [Betaproteobacteria bacterium]HML82342.1 acyloxyacyl hydrolase [Thiomonas arsenitoxydans]
MKRKSIKTSLVAASLLACASIAHAADLSLLWGADKGYHNSTLALESAPLWSHALANSRLDLTAEASLGYAQGPSGTPGASLWHVGLTPFLHWWFTPNTAMEFGIGANVFSGTYIGSKRISTAYQFGDSLGVMHRFAQSPWLLGLRFTHYSNADIKRPNPGQDYFQLRLGYTF